MPNIPTLMKYATRIVAPLIVSCLALTQCTTEPTGPNTVNGAATGAAIGGLLGAVVGHNSHNRTLSGAVIGAAAGGLIGGSMGKAQDDANARARNESTGYYDEAGRWHYYNNR